MKWSINEKMSFMGLFIFLSLLTLLILSRYELEMVKSTKDETGEYESELKQRMKELIEINRYEHNLGKIVLAAKNAIIAKNEGGVSRDKFNEINLRAQYVINQSAKIGKTIDDQSARALFNSVLPDIESLANTVKDDLLAAIGQNGLREMERDAAFRDLDRAIREKSDAIHAHLAMVENELARQIKRSRQESQGVMPATRAKYNVAKIQKWLMEISATRAKDGFDYGFVQAEKETEKFHKNLEQLAEKAPHFRQVAESVRAVYDEYYENAKRMANAYIENGPEGGNPMLGETDALAEDTAGKLGNIIRQIEFARDLTLRTESAIGQLKRVRQAHFEMMLSATEVLVDREQGAGSGKRRETIRMSVEAIRKNIGKLANISDTVEGAKAIQATEREYEKLFQLVQENLNTLIEKRSKEIRQIRMLFSQIEDEIEIKSLKIGDVLRDVRTRAFRNVRDSENVLGRNELKLENRLAIWSWSAYGFFILISAVILTVFVLFAKSVTGPLRNIMRELGAGAKQVATTAREISSAGRTLATGSSDQAASIEETSATLEQMGAMGRETAQLTDGVEKLMNKNIENSAKSLKAIVELTRRMASIEADSDEISQIVKTIDEIAFQTNLLALNAAVEAARAGETGAGFAVVAEEVRTLAIRATEAAETTQTLLEKTVSDIKKSAKSIKNVNRDFDGIIESATIIGEKTASITIASQELAEAIQQIGQSTGQIDGVTQKTAETAREYAAVSGQLGAQAEEMISHVEMLGTIIYGKKRSKKPDGEERRIRTDRTKLFPKP